MGSRRSRERERERELWYLHTESFSRRWFHLGRTYRPGRGLRRAVRRSYLVYLAAIAAVTIPFFVAALVARLLGD